MPNIGEMTRVMSSLAVAIFLAGTATAGVRVADRPSPSPDSQETPWLSTDGDLSLRLPHPWRVAHAARYRTGSPFESAILVGFSDEHARRVMGDSLEGLREDLFKIDLGIDTAAAGSTTATVMRDRCERRAEEIRSTAPDCRSTQINGRTWARMVFRDEIFRPSSTIVAVATVAGGRLYTLTAFIPESRHEADGLTQIDLIYGSLVVRTT